MKLLLPFQTVLRPVAATMAAIQPAALTRHYHGLISMLAAGSVLFGTIQIAATADASPATPTGGAVNAAWSSLSAMTLPVWDGQTKTLLFHSKQGTLAITALSDNVIRVHFTTAGSFGRDHSYAVVNRHWTEAHATARIGPESTVLRTPALKVLIQHDPLRISFDDAAGHSLDADDPKRGMAFG